MRRRVLLCKAEGLMMSWSYPDSMISGYRCLWRKKVAATAVALWPHRGQCKTCRWLYRWVHLNVILVITLTHYNFCFYKPTNRNAAWKTKYHRWRVNVTEKLKTWYGSLSTISRHGTTSTMLCQYSRKQETVYRACRPPAHHFCTGLTFLTWKLCVWCWFTETMSVLVNTYPTKDQTQA